MSFLKNKTFLTTIVFVIPFAVGIPLALYLIPSKKIKNNAKYSDFTTLHKDSVEIKLNTILSEIHKLNERIKKLEQNKTIPSDTVAPKKRHSQTSTLPRQPKLGGSHNSKKLLKPKQD